MRASDSPGGALSSGGRATDTARRLRARATVYDPGGVEHPQRAIVLGALSGAGAASCLLASLASHRAGEQSPFQRGGQLSEAGGGWAIARCDSLVSRQPAL